jgi:ABC-type lipoprotein release transport system permease subunit|tara:strand:+ start:593 stop:922 length:330 start_codon:yes stop_codon:yes gene_type:complete
MGKNPPLWGGILLINLNLSIMEKFLKQLANIPNDKLLHFFYGTIIGFICILFFGVGGFVLTLLIAVLKEIIDYFRYGKMGYWKFSIQESCKDILFTSTPALMMVIISLF